MMSKHDPVDRGWCCNVEVEPTAWHIYRLLNFHQSDHTKTIFKCVFASR